MNTHGGRRRLRAAGVVFATALALLAGTADGAAAAGGASGGGTTATDAKGVDESDATSESADGSGDDSTGEDSKALAEAKRTGKPVEIESMRGESSEVFATPRGNLEAR